MRRAVVLVAAALTVGSPLSAQRERDESRLSFGLTLGATTGTSLWQLQHQPLMDNGGVLDTINLARSIGASISAAFNVIWFPHANLGLGGELMMLGGSFNTQCSLLSATRTTRNQTICTSINRASTTSKAVSVSGGVFYRLRSRSFFSPYVNGRLGVAISQSSTLLVEAFPNGNYGGFSQIVVFSDPAPRHLTPVMMVGLGFTTGIIAGYRLRWEVRDHVTGFERATGTTSGRPNQSPEHYMVYQHRLSLQFGGEIMLDRRRGAQY
jgi:hypothetical protein